MVSDLAVEPELAQEKDQAPERGGSRAGGRRPGGRGPGLRAHRLRQSNSESMILPRHAKGGAAQLDPRIYPAWWGDDHLESPAGPRAPSANEKRSDRPRQQDLQKPTEQERPETSLERGIREIQATALNLDRNLQGIGRGSERSKAAEASQQSGPKLNAFFQSTEPMAGCGSSFYPQNAQSRGTLPQGPFNSDQEHMTK